MIRPVTCRYGVTYNIPIGGSKAAQQRTINMLSNCCCLMCFNSDCKEPRDEKIECNNECEIIWNKNFCNKDHESK